MRRNLALLGILAALTSISLSLPAHAAPGDVLMLQDAGNTPGWDAYIVTAEGGRYTFDWTFTVTRDPVQIGLIHYDGQDNWLGSFIYTSFTYENSHRYELNVIPGMQVKTEEVRDAHGYQLRAVAEGNLPGSPGNPVTRKFLVWTSGAVEQGWTVKLNGPPSAQLARDPETDELISTSGPAYIYMSKDLGGAANVGAQGSVPPNEQLPHGFGPGARAAAIAKRDFPVTRSLVGSVVQLGQQGPFGAQAASVEFFTPGGFRKQCHLPSLVTNEGPCTFHHIAGPKALGAGEYRLQFTGAGAGLGSFGDLLFWYLDAHLPSLPDPSPTPDPTPDSPAPTASPSPSPSESPQPDIADVSFTDNTAEFGQHSDETRFEARLSDSSGEPIESRELTFELRGSESTRSFTATTNEDGVASVTPRLEEKPGPHWLTVRFAGDDEHAADADTASFIVEKEDSALELSVHGEDDDKTLRARLSDLDTSSDGIAARTIDFYSDGELIGSAVTDADGVASVGLPPRHRGNNRTYEAVFEGDDFYLDASDEKAGKGKGGNGGGGGGSESGRTYAGRMLLM